MSPAPPLTIAAKVTILKHLIDDKTDDFILAATGHAANDLQAVKRDHGYPDTDRMTWALGILQGQLDRDALPSRRPALAMTATTKPRSVAPVPAAEATSRPVRTSVEELLHAAGESEFIRTRNLATKIAALIGDLKARLHDEQEAREAAAAKAADRARIDAEIARLQAQIDALRGRQPGPPRAADQSITTDPASWPHACDHEGCDRRFPSKQGLSMHRHRAHRAVDPQGGVA